MGDKHIAKLISILIGEPFTALNIYTCSYVPCNAHMLFVQNALLYVRSIRNMEYHLHVLN